MVQKLDVGQIANAPEVPPESVRRRLRRAPDEAACRCGSGRGGPHRVARCLLAGKDHEPAQQVLILDLRARKDAQEVESVRRACELVERAYARVGTAAAPLSER